MFIAFLRFGYCFCAYLLTLNSVQAECFTAANAQVQFLNKQLGKSAVLLDIYGPEADKCVDVGTGVLISSNGHVLTARHVVDKPGCSKVGVFARFSWDSEHQIEMEVVTVDAADAAILRPTQTNNWPSPGSSYCTAPRSQTEGAPDEWLLRMGRVDLSQRPYGYGGNVILSVSETGSPPLQLICSAIRHGDSGGPAFSVQSGSLVGITVKRRETDIFGKPVDNQGYVLPLNGLNQSFNQYFDNQAQCSSSSLQMANRESLDVDVPYVTKIKFDPFSDATAKFETVGYIFRPMFGYNFNSRFDVSIFRKDKTSIDLPTCQADATNVCYSAERKENTISIVFRNIERRFDSEPEIDNFILYTTQSIGGDAIEYLASVRPDLNEVFSRADFSSVTSLEANSVFEALSQAPASNFNFDQTVAVRSFSKDIDDISDRGRSLDSKLVIDSPNTIVEIPSGQELDWLEGPNLRIIEEVMQDVRSAP